MASVRRRWFLLTCGGALVGASGCQSNDDPSEESEPTPTETAPRTTQERSTESRTSTPEPQQLPDEVTESWAQSRGNSRNTGFRTDVTAPSPSGPATRQWGKRVRMGTIEDMIGTPAVAQGSVVAASDSGIHKFDALTGERIWSVEVETRPTHGSPAIVGNRVYASTLGGLYALTLDEGRVDWQYEADAFATFRNPPIVTNNRVFVSGQGGVFAFTHGGEHLWDQRDFIFGDDVTGIAVDDGTVYAAYQGNVASPGIAAFAAETGEERWSREVLSDNVSTPPVLGPDRVYVGVYSSSGAGSAGIQSFRRADGTLGWHNLPNGGTVTAPAIAGDTVYMWSQTLDREVFALDRNSGEVRWRGERTGPGQLFVAEGQVIHSTNDETYALSRSDGTVQWTVDTGGMYGIALADGLLFTVTLDGLLVALY